MRPKKLATDTAGMYEVILHGINKLKSLEYDFDIIVNRDCTVPFIQNHDIQGTINILKRKKADAVYGVYKQHHNPYFNMMEINSNGFLEYSNGDFIFQIPLKVLSTTWLHTNLITKEWSRQQMMLNF